LRRDAQDMAPQQRTLDAHRERSKELSIPPAVTAEQAKGLNVARRILD
jgi:hypothetical protein